MKTMKRFIAAAMAVTSVMAIAPMSAFAENETGGTTNVSFNAVIEPAYTITIPASVNLNAETPTATIKAEDVYLDTTKHKQINVTLDSAEYVETGASEFIAKTADGSSSVKYTIGKGEATTGVKVGDTVAEFTEDGSQVLSFSAPTGATYAGTHTETLTFGISVEIAVPAGITLTRNMTFGGDPFDWGSSTGTLPTAFVAGKQVAVIYKNTSGQTAKVVSDALTASDISNEGKSATINVTIDDADKTKHVTYIYPATMANDDGTLNTGALDAQNGTLDEDIINCCTTTGAWDGNSLPSLELTSPFAIFKFTTKNSDGSATINVTSLTVTIGAQDYVITPASATSTLYVALPAVSDQAVRFSATDRDGKTYTCSQASVTFAAGKYYLSMLKMAPPITVTWNNDDITGSGNSFTKGGVTIAAGSIDFDEKSFEENGKFTTTLGNFTKIEVVVTNGFCDVSGTGWSGDSDKRTWTGNASSVSFIGDIYGDGNGIKFVFTIEP